MTSRVKNIIKTVIEFICVVLTSLLTTFFASCSTLNYQSPRETNIDVPIETDIGYKGLDIFHDISNLEEDQWLEVQ